MKRLITNFAIIGLLSGCCALHGQAKTDLYCSYEVIVTTPSGDPAQDVVVSASLSDGTLVARVATNVDGIARICDAPTDWAANIQVGQGGCAVTVMTVSPLWLKTRRVRVIHEACGPQELGFSFACYFVLRIRDDAGKPISGVRMTEGSEGPRGREPAVSDQFGRIFRAVRYRESFHGTLERSAFDSTHVNLTCDAKTPMVMQERVVTLLPGRKHGSK